MLISDTYVEEDAALLGDQELIIAEQMLTQLESNGLRIGGPKRLRHGI